MTSLSRNSSESNKTLILRKLESILERALSADEAGKVGDALSLYLEAEIEAHELTRHLNANSDAKIRDRLNAYLANIVVRKEVLAQSLDATLPSVPSAPPAYSEAPTSPSRSISRPPPPESASVMLSLPSIQIYSVSGEGQVSVPSYPDTLTVRRLDDGTPFLQVGEWSCPLIPGETPALLTGDGWNTLMLPDPASLHPKDSVALILAHDLLQSKKEKFLRVMSQLTLLMVSDEGTVRELRENDLCGTQEERRIDEPQPTAGQERRATWPNTSTSESESTTGGRGHTSDLVANGIQITSELLARGLKWGADKGSHLIKHGSDAWRNHIEQNRNTNGDNQSVPVDPRLSNGAQVARSGTHQVVGASAKAVGYLGSAAKSLATWAVPHVRSGAQRVLPTSWTDKSSGRSKAESALAVASAALYGLGTVYEAFEHSAKLVGRATADGTAGVVGARYGRRAGSVTSDILYTVGNVGMTVHNVRQFGPKAVATTVASHGATACNEYGSNKGQSRSQAER